MFFSLLTFLACPKKAPTVHPLTEVEYLPDCPQSTSFYAVGIHTFPRDAKKQAHQSIAEQIYSSLESEITIVDQSRCSYVNNEGDCTSSKEFRSKIKVKAENHYNHLIFEIGQPEPFKEELVVRSCLPKEKLYNAIKSEIQLDYDTFHQDVKNALQQSETESFAKYYKSAQVHFEKIEPSVATFGILDRGEIDELYSKLYSLHSQGRTLLENKKVSISNTDSYVHDLMRNDLTFAKMVVQDGAACEDADIHFDTTYSYTTEDLVLASGVECKGNLQVTYTNCSTQQKSTFNIDDINTKISAQDVSACEDKLQQHMIENHAFLKGVADVIPVNIID